MTRLSRLNSSKRHFRRNKNNSQEGDERNYEIK